jgi:cellulose synthase/poly-beta-1,6-N-acetylglucosamine synthase-like glycosyltransferase
VGLQSIDAPIPLGGTSNHFKAGVLRQLNGWDAFNVTEDADLGMRLVKRGYVTAILDSVTYEEANSAPVNWFWQRTRWIKGYIQTYVVHTRRRGEFRAVNRTHSAIFQAIVGGKVLSLFINPLMWGLTIAYFVLRARYGEAISAVYPAPVLYMAVTSLVAGNFLYLYYYMVGCARRQEYDLIKYVFLVPFYWLAMSIAAYRAAYEAVVKPHHWSKTKHGLHLNLPLTITKG